MKIARTVATFSSRVRAGRLGVGLGDHETREFIGI
jgi:hypothetical protein